MNAELNWTFSSQGFGELLSLNITLGYFLEVTCEISHYLELLRHSAELQIEVLLQIAWRGLENTSIHVKISARTVCDINDST